MQHKEYKSFYSTDMHAQHYTSTKTCQGYVNKYTVSSINHSCLTWSNVRLLQLHYTMKQQWTKQKYQHHLFFPHPPLSCTLCTLTHVDTHRAYQTRTGHTLSFPNVQIWTIPQAAGQNLNCSKTRTHTHTSPLNDCP